MNSSSSASSKSVRGLNTAPAPSLRGIFHRSEDPNYWLSATASFENNVPRFTSKQEAVTFMEKMCDVGSNPDEPHLKHSISTLTCWSQIEKYLLPKIREYNNRWPVKVVDYAAISSRNIFMGGTDDVHHTHSNTFTEQSLSLGHVPTTVMELVTDFDTRRDQAIKAFLKTTAWRRYATDPEPDSEPKVEDGQRKSKTRCRYYYHNKGTGETVWTAPTELRAYMKQWDTENPNTSSSTKQEPSVKIADTPTTTAEAHSVHQYLLSRLNLPIHRRLDMHSTLNTLKYLFHHMRCGILVMIRNNEVVVFCPFVNRDYRNNWKDVQRILRSKAKDENLSDNKNMNADQDNEEVPALHVQAPNGQLKYYYSEKLKHYRRENILPDTAQWWANGNIICNEHEKSEFEVTAAAGASLEGGNSTATSSQSHSQYWGDHFLFQLKDMLCETCRLREMPDCDFFINKRDYPQLKVHTDSSPGFENIATILPETDSTKQTSKMPILPLVPGMPVEPYGFIFDRDDRCKEQDIPLTRELYRNFAPIMSFYTSSRFADIPIPPSEDWEAATGLIFPPSLTPTMAFDPETKKPVRTVGTPRDLFTSANLAKFNCSWDQKQNTAFFRGTATGGGTTIETNQRLHIAQLGWEWTQPNWQPPSTDPNDPTDISIPYLDSKIVGWNLRDKKVAQCGMTFVRPTDFPFEGDRKKNFVEIYKQSRYKYLLYVEGHCAACRYGFMMRLGSVILKVDSKCVADQMWYFPLLRPYYDHVPVKADLSDLFQQIQWCRTHDEECKRIAKNAEIVYNRYISREGVLDYMQSICLEIAQKQSYGPAWLPAVPAAAPAPPPYPGTRHTVCCLPRCDDRCEHDLCGTCAALQEREKLALHEEKVNQGNAALGKNTLKEKLRARMARKASEAQQVQVVETVGSVKDTADSAIAAILEEPPGKRARSS